MAGEGVMGGLVPATPDGGPESQVTAGFAYHRLRSCEPSQAALVFGIDSLSLSLSLLLCGFWIDDGRVNGGIQGL